MRYEIRSPTFVDREGSIRRRSRNISWSLPKSSRAVSHGIRQGPGDAAPFGGAECRRMCPGLHLPRSGKWQVARRQSEIEQPVSGDRAELDLISTAASWCWGRRAHQDVRPANLDITAEPSKIRVPPDSRPVHRTAGIQVRAQSPTCDSVNEPVKVTCYGTTRLHNRRKFRASTRYQHAIR